MGFFHDMGKGGRWISFQYDRLSDMCYRCGILGRIKRNCSAEETANMKILGDLYGLWLKAEVEVALLIRKGNNLRRVENKKAEYFNNFLNDINTEEINGGEEEKI